MTTRAGIKVAALVHSMSSLSIHTFSVAGTVTKVAVRPCGIFAYVDGHNTSV
jgi:hypothetical protein